MFAEFEYPVSQNILILVYRQLIHCKVEQEIAC